VLQESLAAPEDIFLLNFGRWHFHNCIGLLADSYTQSLLQLGAFYQVGGAGRGRREGAVLLSAAAGWVTDITAQL
jgi:hypothetical protein